MTVYNVTSSFNIYLLSRSLCSDYLVGQSSLQRELFFIYRIISITRSLEKMLNRPYDNALF